MTNPTTDRLAEVLDAIANAYEAGCQDVHDNYQPDRDPDFSEAARDYAKNIELPATQSLSTDLNKANEALRERNTELQLVRSAYEGLQQQLKTVLDREAETHARHDAKVDALEQRIADLEVENVRLREGLRSAANDMLVFANDPDTRETIAQWFTRRAVKARAALNQPTGKETDTACFHQWQEVDSQFSNEHFTDVKCSLCNERGQRDEKTGEVFWPAT